MQPRQIPNTKRYLRSKTLVIAKDWDEYDDMLRKVTSTGMFAAIGTVPDPWTVPEEDYKYWYRSSETLGGDNPYMVHLANKKWPLKKVFLKLLNLVRFKSIVFRSMI